MSAILPLVIMVLLFLGILGAAIYETVHATQLSLPTTPLTIPVLLLPLFALANTVFAARSTAVQLRAWGNSNSTEPSPPRQKTLVTVLQIIQSIIATVLATLLAATPAVDSCMLEQRWKQMYSAHDGDGIRRIQDALGCCGFNTPRDRAWPFPHGRGGQQTRCEEAWGRHGSCREPWTGAMRTSVGIELGVIVVVEIFQIITLLVVTGSPYFKRALWYLMDRQTRRSEYTAHNDRRYRIPYRDIPRLADTDRDLNSDREAQIENEHNCDHCGREGGDGGDRTLQQPNNNTVSGLETPVAPNVWSSREDV